MAIKIDQLDDQMISSLVRSVRYNIPEAVEAQVKTALNKEKTGGPIKSRHWRPLSVSAAAAAFIIAAIFIFQPFFKSSGQRERTAPITEIRTEFELTDKNIKILWVQKKDFNLKLNE